MLEKRRSRWLEMGMSMALLLLAHLHTTMLKTSTCFVYVYYFAFAHSSKQEILRCFAVTEICQSHLTGPLLRLSSLYCGLWPLVLLSTPYTAFESSVNNPPLILLRHRPHIRKKMSNLDHHHFLYSCSRLIASLCLLDIRIVLWFSKI